LGYPKTYDLYAKGAETNSGGSTRRTDDTISHHDTVKTTETERINIQEHKPIELPEPLPEMPKLLKRMDLKLSGMPNIPQLAEKQAKEMTEKEERETMLKTFLELIHLDIDEYIEKYRLIKMAEETTHKKFDYQEFLMFFGVNGHEKAELTKNVFNLLGLSKSKVDLK
jgi:hypothetical protein